MHHTIVVIVFLVYTIQSIFTLYDVEFVTHQTSLIQQYW